MSISFTEDVPFPPDLVYAEGGIQTVSTLSATVLGTAIKYRPRKSANATAIFVRLNAVTTAQSLTVGIQSVNSSGLPSGTYLGSTNNGKGTINSPAANTLYEVTLSEQVALTVGTAYAVVVEWTSTTGSLVVVQRQSTIMGYYTPASGGVCGHYQNTSGTWAIAVAQSQLTVGVKTDAANWYEPDLVLPANSVATSSSYASNTTPDEYGNKIVLPAGDVVGMFVSSDIDGAADLVLYNGSDTILKSVSVVPGERAGTGFITHVFRFAGVAITAGTYRVTLLPTTTTVVSRATATYTANQQAGRAMGADCQLTTRTNAGAWTDDSLSRMSIGVLMNNFTATGSSGGGNLVGSGALVTPLEAI